MRRPAPDLTLATQEEQYMRITMYAALVACAALVGSVAGMANGGALRQKSGRHGFGGLFGRLFGSGDMAEARDLILKVPSSFTIAQDGDRITLTGSDRRT